MTEIPVPPPQKPNKLFSRRELLLRVAGNVRREDGTYWAGSTIYLAGLFFALNSLPRSFIEKTGAKVDQFELGDGLAKIGNANVNPRLTDEIASNPVTILRTNIGWPVIEEFLFRYLPGKYADKLGGNHWRVGCASSVLFGFSHNITNDLSLNFDRLPLNQIALGLFNWKIMRQRGFKHAVYSHMTNNGISTGANILYPHLPS